VRRSLDKIMMAGDKSQSVFLLTALICRNPSARSWVGLQWLAKEDSRLTRWLVSLTQVAKKTKEHKSSLMNEVR